MLFLLFQDTFALPSEKMTFANTHTDRHFTSLFGRGGTEFGKCLETEKSIG